MTKKTGLILGIFFVYAVTFNGCSGNLMAKNSSEKITGKKWAIASIAGEIIPDQISVFTEFVQEEEKSGYRVSGFSGCNMFSGQANIEDKNLTVQHLASTRKACKSPENIMQIEFSFLKALESSSAYRIIDNSLEIIDSSGKTILTFKPELLKR